MQDKQHDPAAMEAIFRGRFDSLPSLPSNVVRIFVCCNKDDFALEQQTLWEETLPELQQIFLAQGLDVILVDFNQGLTTTNELAIDTYAFSTALWEIQQCYRLSLGPFFLCLVGDKYGPTPLPAYLDEGEFTNIRHEAFEAGKDVTLLDEWYVKDELNIPAVYSLRPITYKFPFYHNRDVGHQSRREQDTVGWDKVSGSLLELIQHSAGVCHKEGRINQAHPQKQERFFASVVEQQVNHALSLDPSRCMAVLRTFEGIEVSDETASQYMDLLPNGELNCSSKKRLQDLRETLASRLNEENKHNFFLNWQNGISKKGLCPDAVLEHREYLEEFNAAVVTQLRAHIQNVLDAQLEQQHNFVVKDPVNKALLHDVVVHLHHCKQLAAKPMVGFDKLLEQLKSTLQTHSKEQHQMILLFGGEGSGKSSLLAKLAHQAEEALGQNTSVLLRHIGITQTSNSPQELLRGICTQLRFLLKIDLKQEGCSMGELVESYHLLLTKISTLKGPPQNFVLILDGIDNLRQIGLGTEIRVDWLTAVLSPKVHIVASFTNTGQNGQLFTEITGKLSQKESIITIPHLQEKEAWDMLTTVCGTRDFKPKEEFKKVLNSSGKQNTPALLLELMAEEMSLSAPNCSNSETNTFSSVEEVVDTRLQKLQDTHGSEVVGHIIRYISSAHHGLSEMELLDLLSCNNESLLLAYPCDMPSVLRFPHCLWAEIRRSIGCLLNEVHVDKKTLLVWRNRTVSTVAVTRHFTAIEHIRGSHKDLADLFQETWITNKPMVVPSRNLQIIDGGSRHPCLQPMLYSETKYNLRRLHELWYHLVHMGELEGLKSYAACNFEYLLAKLHATSITHLLQEVEYMRTQILDADILLLFCCLRGAIDTLVKDPLQLASELIGRLRQLTDRYPEGIAALVQQCMEWCDSFCSPLLVPLTSWLPDPRVSLVTSITCSDDVNFICPTTSGQHLFCATSKNDIRMYQIASGKLIKTFTGHRSAVTCLQVSHDSRSLISGSSDSTVRVWDIGSGKGVNVIKEHSESVLCMALLNLDDVVITGSKDKTVKLLSLESGDVMHTQKAHNEAVTCLVVNSVDSIAATGSRDGTVKLWGLEELNLLDSLEEGIGSPVTSMALTADNTFMLLGCENQSLQVWSFTTGSFIHSLEGHDSQVESLATSNDCFHAVAACSNGSLCVYNLRTCELLDTFCGHNDGVSSVCVSRDQEFIISAGKDLINVWTFYRRHTLDIQTDNHKDMVSSLCLAKDGKIALSGGRDNVVKLWNLDSCQLSSELSGHVAAITCLDVAGDEAFVVSGSEDCTVRVWSLTMACVVTLYEEHDSIVLGVSVLNDNERVLSWEQDQVIKLWLAEDGTTLLWLTGPTHFLVTSPNSQLAVSGDGDSALKLWTLNDGLMIQTVNHTDTITCATFSPDSQFLVTGSTDMSLKVWEAATGKLTQVLVEHEGAIHCVAVTSENRHVVSGSGDCRVLVWGMEKGAVEHVLIGHTDVITALQVTQDGTVAISGSKDGTVRAWSVAHGTLMTLFSVHVPVREVLMTPDASHIVLRLDDSVHVPLMCLHNSPTINTSDSHNTNHSQTDISVRPGSPLLPIKPRYSVVRRLSSVYPVPRKSQKNKRSTSSPAPEIIKVSPIKAPLKSMVKAQEHSKDHETKVIKDDSSERVKTKKEKKSSICTLL